MTLKFPPKFFWRLAENDGVLLKMFELIEREQPLASDSTEVWKPFFKLFYEEITEFEHFKDSRKQVYNYKERVLQHLVDISGKEKGDFRYERFMADDWMEMVHAARERLDLIAHDEDDTTDDDHVDETQDNQLLDGFEFADEVETQDDSNHVGETSSNDSDEVAEQEEDDNAKDGFQSSTWDEVIADMCKEWPTEIPRPNLEQLLELWWYHRVAPITNAGPVGTMQNNRVNGDVSESCSPNDFFRSFCRAFVMTMFVVMLAEIKQPMIGGIIERTRFDHEWEKLPLVVPAVPLIVVEDGSEVHEDNGVGEDKEDEVADKQEQEDFDESDAQDYCEESDALFDDENDCVAGLLGLAFIIFFGFLCLRTPKPLPDTVAKAAPICDESPLSIRDESPPPSCDESPPPSHDRSPPPSHDRSPPPTRALPSHDGSPPPSHDRSPPPSRDRSPPPTRALPSRDRSPPPSHDERPPPSRDQRPPPSCAVVNVQDGGADNRDGDDGDGDGNRSNNFNHSENQEAPAFPQLFLPQYYLKSIFSPRSFVDPNETDVPYTA